MLHGTEVDKMAVESLDLGKFYLFAGLEREHIERLEELSSEQEYARGRMLFLEGERAERLNILTEGTLKVYKSDPRGNEVVLSLFQPVALIAELANLEGIPYPASAVFETDGRVVSIDYAVFEREFLRDPEISISIIKSLTRKMRALDAVISNGLTMDSTGKVARFICENECMFAQLKQHKIATMLNITPETMSRVVRKFRDSGAIEKSGNRFRVVDPERLREFF